MEDEYVRKDVFDETVKRLETEIAASEARHELITARLAMDRGITIIALLIAAIGVFLAALPFVRGVIQ